MAAAAPRNTVPHPIVGCGIFFATMARATDSNMKRCTTSAATIYAVAKQDDNYSEVTTISTGAGTTIGLNVPSVSVTFYDEEGI